MLRRPWILLLSVALVPAACSGDGGSGSTASSVSQADFPTEYASAVCGGFTRCCGQQQLTFDEAACKTKVETAFRDLLSGLPPQQRFDGARGATCLDFARALTCEYDVATEDLVHELTPCETFIVGSVAVGGTCQHSADCERPVGALTRNCTDGICTVALRSALGEACGTVGAVEHRCTDDAACVGGTCKAKGTGGEPCTSGDECRTLDCLGNRCTSLQPTGGECFVPEGCLDGWCEGMASPMHCTPLGANGAPCTAWSECESLACEGGVCVALRHRATASECAGNFDL